MIGGMLDTLGRRRRNKDQEMDKLLVVMPPRERMAFGILLLFVFAAGVWALFGSVIRTVSFDCILHRTVPDRSWQATVLAPPAVARDIVNGMAARIEIISGTDMLELSGEVVPSPAEYSPLPREEGLAAELIRSAAVNWRRIDIAGRQAIPVLTPESTCWASIALGRQRIIDLIRFAPPS